MKEIGALLRETREQKGISLDEVSRETKIQEKYLKSLEEGDFTPFAGKVYVKGALKNYAEAIGMEAQEIADLFEEANKQHEVIEEEKKEKSVLSEKGKPRFVSKEKKPFPMAAFVWVLLLGLIVAGGLWYHFQQSSKPETAIPYNNEIIEDNEEENDEDPGIVDENNLENEAYNNETEENDIYMEPQEELTLISQEGGEHIYSLQGVEEKKIEFVFSARCWVQVFQDDQKIEEQNFGPGETLNIGDGSKTRIRLGYPAGVRITVNGMDVESIKDLGSPVYVVIETN